MSRSPVYPSVRLWILGRIYRHPSSAHSMPARMLVDPPQYLLTTALDVADELRELIALGWIHCTSQRWWLRNPRAVARELKRAGFA
ncbi:MAG TPA: hypothetical protein VNM39_13240 [Verrucomicrobiae bacterium]|nr:hypothetical protein [Verrucomicrobiae bacterium]